MAGYTRGDEGEGRAVAAAAAAAAAGRGVGDVPTTCRAVRRGGYMDVTEQSGMI